MLLEFHIIVKIDSMTNVLYNLFYNIQKYFSTIESDSLQTNTDSK